MRRLQTLAFLQAVFLLALFWNAPFASADTSILGKTDCPAGSSTTDPSGTQSFSASANAAADVKAYLYKVESCASACYNENISVTTNTDALTITFNTTATNECKSDPTGMNPKPDNMGCAKGQTQPQVTVTFPGISGSNNGQAGTKSRCYAALSNTLGGIFQGGITSNSLNPQSIQNAQNVFEDFSSSNAPPISASAGAIAGNSDLINALTNSGVPTAAAQTLASDPASAQALINAYASGNPNTIQDTLQDASAKAGINLNGSVYDSVANLSSTQLDNAATTLAPLADNSGTVIANADTFTEAQTNNASGLANQVSGSCAQMGGCGACQSGFPSMEQGIAAQANLLTTSSCYYGSGNNTILGAMCGNGGSCPGYAVGYTANACTSYATAISNYTGISMNQTIDPQNSSTIAQIMMAQSRVESGYGVVYTPNQLESGFSLLYGNSSIPSGTPNYTPMTVYNPANGSIFAGSSNGGQVIISSPFANVSPVYTTPGLGSAPIFPTVPSAIAPAQAAPTYPTAPVAAGFANSGTSVSQITAQPQTLVHGNSITLEWSSVGMDATPACQVFESGSTTPLAQSDAGSSLVPTSASGVLTFTLQCVAQANGQTVTAQSSPVVVQ